VGSGASYLRPLVVDAARRSRRASPGRCQRLWQMLLQSRLPDSRAKWRTQDAPHLARTLSVDAGAVGNWLVWLDCLYGFNAPVGYIETAELKQPKIADSLFTHPHNIKGVMRFFSDHQQQIYRVARPLMIGSWAATLVLFSVYGHIEDQ
jgi:hypothetical protein